MDFGSLVSVSGYIALIVSAVLVGLNRGKSQIIDDYARITANLRNEIHDNERRCDERINEQQATISNLQGRMEILQSQQAESLSAALAPHVVKGVVEALNTGDWGNG